MEKKSYSTQPDISPHAFYYIPRALIRDPRYDGLSVASKILYGVLLDAWDLAAISGQVDRDGQVYITYSVEQVAKVFSCTTRLAQKYLGELDDVGLISIKKEASAGSEAVYLNNLRWLDAR